MPTRNLSLTDHLDRFIEMGIASGQYSKASDVVREGLRLLEQREAERQAKLDWLRAAAQQGLNEIQQGKGLAFESTDEIDGLINRIGDRVSAELTAKGKSAETGEPHRERSRAVRRA